MHHFAADSEKMSGNYFRFLLITFRSLELCAVAARAAERLHKVLQLLGHIS